MRDKFRNLVMFEEEAGGGTGGGSTETPPNTDTPKYTDKQLNDLIVKNTSKEVSKILKDAGVEDVKALGELVKTAKGGQEKKPGEKAPEENPALKEIEELKKNQNEITARADKNEARAEALSAGVKPENIDRVVKLAMSPAYEGTIVERVAKILSEVPEFVTVPGAAFGKEQKKETQDETETILNAARRAAGLPIAETVKK